MSRSGDFAGPDEVELVAPFDRDRKPEASSSVRLLRQERLKAILNIDFECDNPEFG